ncbi:MAG: ribosomal protein S18 acetylase RimI-like enzyme [Verrucomicrobiales bacterium]
MQYKAAFTSQHKVSDFLTSGACPYCPKVGVHVSQFSDERILVVFRDRRYGLSMIRKYCPADLDRLKEITTICFEGVSIDRNIETTFGQIGEHDWQWRKLRHIDNDVAGANAEGVFVYQDGSNIVGYITCRLDAGSKIGWIPNMAVIPAAQGKGIGKQLMEHAFGYFKGSGMELAKIETLEQNPIGQVFYPGVGFEEVGRQLHYAKKL